VYILISFVFLLCDFRSCLHYGAGWIGCGLRTREFWKALWLDNLLFVLWTMYLRYFLFVAA